jgi:hypothetical protein
LGKARHHKRKHTPGKVFMDSSIFQEEMGWSVTKKLRRKPVTPEEAHRLRPRKKDCEVPISLFGQRCAGSTGGMGSGNREDFG